MRFSRLGGIDMVAEQITHTTAYASALHCFDLAADALSLTADVRALLRSPEHLVHVDIPVAMDDGRTGHFAGCRVVHNTWLGPAGFDIRRDSLLAPEDVMARAMCRTWQYGLLDLPFGGGVDGIAVKHSRLSESELERLNRGYVLGVDSAFTDGGAKADGALPPYSRAFCGGLNEARGRGLFQSIKAACEHLGIPLEGARVAVHGYGSLGSLAAALMASAGARIVSVSDTRGTILNLKGLNLEKLNSHKTRAGSVTGFSGSEPVTESELLSLDCDVLLAAASENAIRRQNAPQVCAKAVAEAADGSITAEAAAVLDGNGVFVLPHLLCNAGAAAGAYYEWLRSARDLALDDDDAYGGVERAVAASFNEVLKVSLLHNVDLRRAAYMLGISRVADALQRDSGIRRTRPAERPATITRS